MRYATLHGAYEIESLPSQPQVAHCHGFFIHKLLQRLGLGHALKAHQNKQLAILKYDYAICTVCGNNAAQKSVLAQAGWAKLAEFTSGKTGEEVEIWGWEVSSELT